MSWSHALRRPRVEYERRTDYEAKGDGVRLLRTLADAYPAWTPMSAIGGYAGSQTVYGLRNVYGADIIETIVGKGYRLSKRGLEIARQATQKVAAE